MLNRYPKAGISEVQFLNILYDIWSKGLRVESARHFFITLWTSSVISEVGNGDSGSVAWGIHAGGMKVFGWEE